MLPGIDSGGRASRRSTNWVALPVGADLVRRVVGLGWRRTAPVPRIRAAGRRSPLRRVRADPHARPASRRGARPALVLRRSRPHRGHDRLAASADRRPAPTPATKDEASHAVLPLPDLSAAALRDHRARQQRWETEAGPAWHVHDLVLTSRYGRPIEPRNSTETSRPGAPEPASARSPFMPCA